jgi:uncharacterized membrane protein
LLATLGLIYLALCWYPLPLMAIGIFTLPITLFQMGSASLDSVAFALTLLAASLFMRAANSQYTFGLHLQIAMHLFLVVLAMARQNLLLLPLLPAVLYPIRHRQSLIILSTIGFALALFWLLFASLTVYDVRPRDLSSIQIAKYYLTHIPDLVHVTFATFSDAKLLEFYLHSFVGILGWLDTPLRPGVYLVFSVLLGAITVLSVSRNRHDFANVARLTLFCAAVVSTGMLFLILLFAWTTHPATVIEGIQGRYFIPIAILLAFAVFNRRLSARERRAGMLIIVLMLVLSVSSVTHTLLDRYWLSDGTPTTVR